MFKEGDKLYGCFNGVIEEATLIEEHRLVYTVKREKFIGKGLVTKTTFFPTKKEAYEQYLQESEVKIERLVEQRKKLEEEIKLARQEVIRIRELIEYVR